MSALCLVLVCVFIFTSSPASAQTAYDENLDEDYELDEMVEFAGSDVENNAEKHESDVLQVNPMLILPLTLPRIAKKALTALARWRPFGSYVQAAASAVAARVTGPDKLDLITAVPRARMGREGFGGMRQRTRFQPLRFGRRKRLTPHP